MSLTVIKNAIFPDGVVRDLCINDGKIAEIGMNLAVEGADVVCADGLHVFPGLVDIHCHLREPGFEWKEDILSGSKAAVHGGFTSICCMPNTQPALDSRALVSYVRARGKEVDYAKVYPIGCITKGMRGEELAEMGDLKLCGAVAVSDDGKPVSNSLMMRLALEYAKGLNLPVISHCEDLNLVNGGVANEGYHATVCGLNGNTRAAEEVMVSREIILADALKTRVHIAHVSTRGSIALIRDAKRRGIQVTCETCPHYFSATDEMVLNYDTNAKVNPPLRTDDDVAAVIEGIIDGTIDAIATDHAPHGINEKNVEFNLAACGICGFETAFALSYTNLVKPGHITLERLCELMTVNPANILSLNVGTLEVGTPADLFLADLSNEYEIKVEEFLSKSKNSPFGGFKVYGNVLTTFVDGKMKMKDGAIL